MGTRRSRHNRGRKPLYKEHREVASNLLQHKAFGGFGWYNYRTWWTDVDQFKLEILSEAESDIEGVADCLGRPPKSIAFKARDLGFVVPSDWLKLITPKRKPRAIVPPLLSYPYIAKARPEHSDLLEVNSIIPKSIPENMRADMCQEIMLAIFEGRTTLEALRAKKANGTYFIKKFYHDNYEQGGHAISFNDVKEDWDEDSIASSIAAKEWHREQFSERTAYGDSLRTFTAPTQFEAAWQDQIGRFQLRQQELGQFLSREEAEALLSEGDE